MLFKKLKKRNAFAVKRFNELHRCTQKGCGKFFSTFTDAILHELRDNHCQDCGWGIKKLGGRCHACLFMDHLPFPKDKGDAV